MSPILSDRITNKQILLFSFLTAVIATSGSLYFSLGMGLFPCRLCWYQRILMYPQVIIIGVAVFHHNTRVYTTVLPFTVLGILISGYHSYIQIWPPSTGCGLVSCSTVQFKLLNALTIPNLAFIAFSMITISMILLVLRTE